MKRIALAATLVAAVALYAGNASWRVAPPASPGIRLIAHRGVHQTYSHEDLTSETCTASRIDPPVHGYIENTIPSMRAAFAAGAEVVELDVHPTTDGRLVVLHDWTLDCRTDGSGVTREHDLATLQALDVGHGYTADGGRSFPLRGRGRGLVPELSEVLAAFPDGRFLVNFKSREAREGDLLAALVAARAGARDAVWGVYGGDPPTRRAAELLGGGVRAWTRRSVAACLGRYLALGWTGILPAACRQTTILVPINVAPWLWGWPNLFLQRVHAAGSEVVLTGPYTPGATGARGIDTIDDLARVPRGFSGWLWTDKIEIIGPALRNR